MERTNKIVGRRDTPGSAKNTGNALLLNFGLKITRRKGEKGPKFPVKKTGKPRKTAHPEKPRNMY